MKTLERQSAAGAGLRDTIRDLKSVNVINAVVAILFSSTGPVAIIVAVGFAGGLTEADIASWIFGGFVIGGLVTIVYSVYYRQPLSFAWTIPGSVLLGTSLDHLSFAEVIGAYWATGILMLLIGLSGGVRKALKYTPMPIVMGMVAGVFLQFGLDVVLAFTEEFWLACMMVAAFVAISAVPSIRKVMPPVVAALAAGVIVVWWTGNIQSVEAEIQWFGIPNLYWPQFSQQAMIELVVPLAITVLVVQNGQGFAVLTAAGHNPPANSMTFACGVGSMLYALFGSVCTCVTGPANAILSSSGEVNKQYTAGVVYGILSTLFGLFAFGATWLILSLPPAFIAILGGLALMPVLLRSFVDAFSSKFQLGALVTMLVTLSDISIWNIGAPFWGLVFGFAISGLLERDDFRSLSGRSLGSR